jgi:hypothetical protein
MTTKFEHVEPSSANLKIDVCTKLPQTHHAPVVQCLQDRSCVALTVCIRTQKPFQPHVYPNPSNPSSLSCLPTARSKSNDLSNDVRGENGVSSRGCWFLVSAGGREHARRTNLLQDYHQFEFDVWLLSEGLSQAITGLNGISSNIENQDKTLQSSKLSQRAVIYT